MDYAGLSTDYAGHSTDCKTLPEVAGLPDVAGLLDVARVYAMARVGRGIVGSEKMTRTATMPRSPEPEVVGLRACQLQPAHGGPD